MRLKKLLMATMLGGLVYTSVPAYADTDCFYMCFFQDLVGMAAGFVARELNRHTETIHYDVNNGVRKVKENIGLFKEEGKCGVSATGTTGCDLMTEEEGAAAAEEMQNQVPVIPQSSIDIIEFDESKGDIRLDGTRDDVKTVWHKGDKFDRVRANVANYMFKSDDVEVNEDCKCGRGTGSQCDESECAQGRQNDALHRAVVGAAATGDAYLKDVDANYNKLEGLVSEINSAKTIADFVGKLGRFSVYASSAVADLMALQAHDLRAQSYRALVFGGITPVDLSGLEKGETK